MKPYHVGKRIQSCKYRISSGNNNCSILCLKSRQKGKPSTQTTHYAIDTHARTGAHTCRLSGRYTKKKLNLQNHECKKTSTQRKSYYWLNDKNVSHVNEPQDLRCQEQQRRPGMQTLLMKLPDVSSRVRKDSRISLEHENYL